VRQAILRRNIFAQAAFQRNDISVRNFIDGLVLGKVEPDAFAVRIGNQRLTFARQHKTYLALLCLL